MTTRVELSIIGSNSDVIRLLNKPAFVDDDPVHKTDFGRLKGGSGFGKPPVSNRWFTSALAGSQFRGQRVLPRTLSIPAAAFGRNAAEVEARFSRISAAVSGQATLKAIYPDGKAFTIPIVYEDGLQGDYDRREETVQEFDSIVFSCPDPHWTSESVDSEIWSVGEQVGFLESLELSPSTLTGAKTIINKGPVDSPPTWIVKGPASSFGITVNGRGFKFNSELTAADTLTVRWTGAGWTVTDQTGANRYSDIVRPARFPFIPPGQSSVGLIVADSTFDTSISVFWPERKEVIF